MQPGYAELHALSNFTFLRGASHPEELVTTAAALGYRALALTDECSVAGIVRAYSAARKLDLQLIAGSELRLTDATRLVVLATSRQGYAELCHLITLGRRAAEKGEYTLCRDDFASGLPHCLVLWLPGAQPNAQTGAWVAEQFPGRSWLAVELLAGGRDRNDCQLLDSLGRRLGLPRVAAGDVHMHRRSRRALQDTLIAIRLKTTLDGAGFALYPNGERHLRARPRLALLYPQDMLDETLRVAERCDFSLDELRYEYPRELVPEGQTPATYLRRLTEEGMRRRWPHGATDKVKRMIRHELGLISELAYEPYFLTVYDLVRFARKHRILCQGRGSAANSAVCFCLSITEVDPARMATLFERFISRERNEPPDIDVDFEHERREEVIQYIYRKYGRERAALAATVITYRPRSAIRDVGKALGLDPLQVDRLARAMRWISDTDVDEQRIREAGFSPETPVIARLLRLVRELIGFPRHLSQHVGGFVFSAGPLYELVPIENAAMPERTVIQWDKEDIESLGLLKVDILALGMLSAIRKSLQMVHRYCPTVKTISDIPKEDRATYQMLQAADTIGVFQIESRAQMSMLPRLKPERFYDLVIEIAIVRPGPIQGDMVHPYLRRKQGLEQITYPSAAIRSVLERTLGVPIFQEQVIRLAMVAAGFSGGEADQLRRAITNWGRNSKLLSFEKKLTKGMIERGYDEGFARRLFEQIKGFGGYG